MAPNLASRAFEDRSSLSIAAANRLKIKSARAATTSCHVPLANKHPRDNMKP
jgi:hypothetical protein